MRYTGLTANTAKKLLLDAGAFFKNYDMTKSYADNASALIGATQGGGSFSAVPTVRKIEVDGAKGNVKGMQTIDEWVVTMTANVKEITADSLKLSLGAASSSAFSTTTYPSYTQISADADYEDADYATNLTWVGRLSGSSQPVIIVVKNALCLNGLSLTMADKAEGAVSVVVTGHYSLEDLETPPFEIYYPPVA